jgi:hypothetical protein
MVLRVETSRFLRELLVTEVGWKLPYGGASSVMFLLHVEGGKSVDAPSKKQLGKWLQSDTAAFWGVVSCKEHIRVHYYKTNPSRARGLLQSCPMVELTEPRGAPQVAAERTEPSATEPSAPASTSIPNGTGQLGGKRRRLHDFIGAPSLNNKTAPLSELRDPTTHPIRGQLQPQQPQ